MDSSEQGTEIQSVVNSEPQGCWQVVLFVFVIAWIIGAVALSQTLSWSLEQTIFDGEISLPDVRWLIELIYGIAILIPLVLSVIFVKNPRFKASYQTWLMAGLLALAVTPLRLLPIIAEQSLELLQIIVLLLFIRGILIWVKHSEAGKSPNNSKPAFRGIGLAILTGAIMAYPWVLWGALGSPVDILLQICVALLFGTAAAMTLQFGLFRITQSGEAKYTTRNMLFDGLVSTITLLILLSALGQGGDQTILLISIPLLGFGLPLLSRYGVERDNRNNWPALATTIGLAVAWPLLWVNADELMAVSNGDPGELFQWALQAASVELILSVVLIIVWLIMWSKLEKVTHDPTFAWVGTVLVCLALIPVYILWGRPGFYGERLFVILKSQPDVSQAVTIKDYNQRRQYVYQTLVKNAESSQKGIRADLDHLGIHYTPYYLVNGLEVQAGPFVNWWLSSRPEVDRVLYDPILRPLPKPIPVTKGTESAPSEIGWNLSLIGANRVWQDFNVRGKGVIIGQNDSGVQGDHPELADNYVGKGGKNDYAWLDPWYHTTRPTDINGHGTHTLGIILGKNVGIAPDAQWIACVNLARNLGNPAYYLNCWQFMLAPFPENGDPFRDGDVTRGAEILNNSWGCPTVEGCDPTTFLPAVKALRDAGIFVVVSAGNSGLSGCGTVEDPPSIYDQVMTVGAIDGSGQLADFSSLGPVKVDGSNRVKPDLVAPGVDVLSSFPGNAYQSESGTSMAGPNVVGVVALMWSANPALIGNIDQTDQILLQNTQPYHGTLPTCVNGGTKPSDGFGYGVLDAYQTVKAAIDLKNNK
ncbi:MAG TPA: S8 family serine peptidase [Anaerolineaceae bacterium]|nr:S8 family serine peptidase [Anaerolineaceae bacterium]